MQSVIDSKTFRKMFGLDGNRKGSEKKPNKYRATKQLFNGVRYDSKAEAARAAELHHMFRAGEIRGVLRQVPFDLGEGFRYRADFLVFENSGIVHAEDVKGVETQRFRDIRRLWPLHAPCDLHVLKGSKIEIIPGKFGLTKEQLRLLGDICLTAYNPDREGYMIESWQREDRDLMRLEAWGAIEIVESKDGLIAIPTEKGWSKFGEAGGTKDVTKK